MVRATTMILCAAVIFGLLARPAGYLVEGVSMAPGLLPGDAVATGWFPILDRFRSPDRFECWTLSLADGTPAIKRIVGRPGETVSITDGDLVIDGSVILKSPRILAAVGTPLEPRERTSPESAGWRWMRPSREVLDDARVVETRSRLLLPVHDVGVVAIVQVHRLPAAADCRVRIRVGDRVVPWRLTAAGSHALVAGRLDGHLVAAAWLIPADAPARSSPRSCLPPGAPARWQAVHPWPQPGDALADDVAPWLAIGIEAAEKVASLEAVTIWRDILHRPTDTGPTRWTLGPGEFLVLGDFPAGSTDSRHWGPVPADVLGHRITGVR